MAPTPRVYKVKGLRELLWATDNADKATKRMVRDRLREVAEPVRRDATRMFARYDAASAGTYRTAVKRVGVVAVQQSRRKTTGKRPDFGALQMRKALLPAAVNNQDEVADNLGKLLDKILLDWGE